MTITTRESISYQFSLIFGYSSPNDEVIVGDVVGPGKLTREKVNELSLSVIKFLRMYNAILRDYAGAEVFSIEFSLYNYDEKDAQTKIYPKSLFLIPGNFKECESLLLALKPETGYLDTHKSRSSVNKISELFFEVEEFTNRPELQKEERQQVLKNFASRFSQKLYGELIEDKWNKKLIGLSTSLPTEKEMLNTYAAIKSDIDILWYQRPAEIIVTDSKFTKTKTPFEGQAAIEHLKYSISEPSADFIIENTLKLGTNLINLANAGTIDETQDKIVSFLIKRIETQMKSCSDSETGDWIIKFINKQLSDLESYLNKFSEYSFNFLKSGETGTLIQLTDKYKKFIEEQGKLEGENFEEICNLAIDSITESITQKVDLRAIELESLLRYFEQKIKSGIKVLKTSLPKYLSRRRMKTLEIEFIKNLTSVFEKEQKPARILGQKFIQKFNDYILNKIEISPLLLAKNIVFNEKDLIQIFKELISSNIDPFFETIKLDIGDLVSFAEVMMEEESEGIKSHIEKFMKFSSELHYLLSYILRYSTITRYIKDEPDEQISDPVMFANKFHRYLEKRIGAINLAWKSYILDWIKDYSKKFFNLGEQKDWTLKEIYHDFISYFEQREENEQQPEKFIDFLDTYIAKITDSNDKRLLLEFFQQYEMSVDIKSEFPKYVKNKIVSEISSSTFESEKLNPIDFLSIDGEDSLYNYIKEMELKYFSKLVARPFGLILKQNLTNEEKELFKGDLFHVINFRFWQDSLKIDISDNFKEVYREWMKEL